MTALATERSRRAAPAPAWPGLSRKPERLFDAPALRAAIDAAAGKVSATDLRATAVGLVREAYTDARQRIADAIAESPREAHRARYNYAWVADQVTGATLDLVANWIYPPSNATVAERVSALAVGGYGRAEMAPFSDVDLLFLTPYKQTPWGESLIESVLYCLWDLRLKVGHSARTIDDCIRFARTDTTIRTSLLENRLLWGDRPLAAELDRRLWSELFSTTGPEFVALKLAERAERHERQGSARYLLEPNVKESKGGLRDLQTLYWIAKYLNNAKTPADLSERGVSRPRNSASSRRPNSSSGRPGSTCIC